MFSLAIKRIAMPAVFYPSSQKSPERIVGTTPRKGTLVTIMQISFGPVQFFTHERLGH